MKQGSHLWNTTGASSSGVTRLIISSECKPCKNLTQRSSQANLDSSHTALNVWTQGTLFPKHAHLQQPSEENGRNGGSKKALAHSNLDS